MENVNRNVLSQLRLYFHIFTAGYVWLILLLSDKFQAHDDPRCNMTVVMFMSDIITNGTPSVYKL